MVAGASNAVRPEASDTKVDESHDYEAELTELKFLAEHLPTR